MSVGERIKKARKYFGKFTGQEISQMKLAEYCGWPGAQTRISNYENGTRDPSPNDLILIARATGSRVEWLQFGSGEMEANKSSDTSNVTNITDKLLQSPNDDLFIPISDATASMGNGNAVLSHEIVIGHLKVSRQWIRNTLSISKPDNLAVITAFGDSMAPTFSDGDTLLIDRGVNEMKVDAVYVIAMNDELFVKRVQRRMDGALVIKSDNPLYDPYVVENGDKNELEVLGRVAWVWNGKKL